MSEESKKFIIDCLRSLKITGKKLKRKFTPVLLKIKDYILTQKKLLNEELIRLLLVGSESDDFKGLNLIFLFNYSKRNDSFMWK